MHTSGRTGHSRPRLQEPLLSACGMTSTLVLAVLLSSLEPPMEPLLPLPGDMPALGLRPPSPLPCTTTMHYPLPGMVGAVFTMARSAPFSPQVGPRVTKDTTGTGTQRGCVSGREGLHRRTEAAFRSPPFGSGELVIN